MVVVLQPFTHQKIADRHRELGAEFPFLEVTGRQVLIGVVELAGLTFWVEQVVAKSSRHKRLRGVG